jgi:hypothetical protein
MQAATLLIPSAVDASLEHLNKRRQERERDLIPLLRVEERRLRHWRNQRRELLQTRMAQLGEQHPRARRYQKDVDEMESYLRDREKNWRDTHFSTAQEPATRLVLVIEGVR